MYIQMCTHRCVDTAYTQTETSRNVKQTCKCTGRQTHRQPIHAEKWWFTQIYKESITCILTAVTPAWVINKSNFADRSIEAVVEENSETYRHTLYMINGCPVSSNNLPNNMVNICRENMFPSAHHQQTVSSAL